MRKALLVLFVLILSDDSLASIPLGNPLAGVLPDESGHIDVLTVFAHQDDETIYGGGTLFIMKRDPRVRLYMLCMTLGDMSEAKERLGITSAHLGRIRSKELETAGAVYGAERVIQLDYHDQSLKNIPPEELAGRIVAVIEEVGAEIVITHDPVGITGHPDHVACSRSAFMAFAQTSAQRLFCPTLPYFIYRSVLTPAIKHAGVNPLKPTFKVDITEVKKLKRMAFYAHASQKHFSSVGTVAKPILALDYEYFAIAGSH